MGSGIARYVLPIAAGIVAGAISGGLLGPSTYAATSVFAGLSGAAGGAIVGGALGALSVGISLLAELLSPKPPSATSRIDNVTLNTFTRTGRVPLVYGYRKVGAQVVLLGKLEFRTVAVGINAQQESHLFGQMVLGIGEGEIRQVLGVEADELHLFPETWSWTRGTASEVPVVGFDTYVAADQVPTFRHTATVTISASADLGFVSDVPPFGIEVRGIYPERSLAWSRTMNFTPQSGSFDGITNRFFFIPQIGGGVSSPSGLVVVTVPYAQETVVSVQIIPAPQDVSTSIRMGWYVGLCDTVVLQDPVSLSKFWFGNRTSTAARDSWTFADVGAGYERPILFWYLDDRSARLHTLHQAGASFYVSVLNLMTLERDQILIPDEVGITSILAFLFKPEDNSYYMVAYAKGIYTLSSYSVAKATWEDLVVVSGAGITGLIKLGVFAWITRAHGADEINLPKKTITSIGSGGWADSDHDLGGSPAFQSVQQCSSRYAGVVILTGSGNWRVQVVYGPLRDGETFMVPMTFRRHIVYNVSTGTRIPRQVGDETLINDTVWATTGPADQTLALADLEAIPADYKTTDSVSGTYELIAASEAARTKVYYYWPSLRNKGFMRVVWLCWDTVLVAWRLYHTAYDSDIGGAWNAGDGLTVGNAFRARSPEKIERESEGADVLLAPIFIAGRAIKRGANQAGTLADPDTVIRTVATTVLDDQEIGETIYECTSWTTVDETAPILSGTAVQGGTVAQDQFPKDFPLLQIFDNFNNDNNTAISGIAASLQEAPIPNQIRVGTNVKPVTGVNSAGTAISIAASTTHIASWEAKGLHEMTLSAESQHPLCLFVGGARMDFWQDRCTPAAERFDVITNTRYGRGAALSMVNCQTHLSLHGFSRERVAVIDTVDTDTSENRDDAATLYAGNPVDFQGDHLQFYTLLNGQFSEVYGVANGTVTVRFVGGRIELVGTASFDAGVTIAYPTTNSIGIRVECYYRSHATNILDFEPNRIAVFCRGSNGLGNRVFAFLEQNGTNTLRLAVSLLKNGTLTRLYTSTTNLVLPGTASSDDLLTLRISATVSTVTASVVWITHGWTDSVVIDNTELADNNRCGYLFLSNGTAAVRRTVTRWQYTRLVPQIPEVLHSFLGTDSYTGATLQYRVLPGWRSGIWSGPTFTEVGGDAGYQSAVNPGVICIDAIANTVISPAANYTIMYRTDEVQAIEITYRDISSGDDQVHPIFRLSADKRQWIQVLLTRMVDTTTQATDAAFYYQIWVVKYSVNSGGGVTQSSIDIRTFDPFTSAGQGLNAAIFNRAGFVRWEMEGDYIIARVNGIEVYRSVAVTDYRINPYYGVGMQPADSVLANTAAGFRIVTSTSNTPPLDPNPITTIERYAHNHLILDATTLDDVLDEIDQSCFGFNIGRPNEFAVGFESGYAQPIMRFTASMIKPDSFSIGVRNSRAGPNRIIIRFFNELDRREDSRVVDEENDQAVNGVREKEVTLTTVTNPFRAIYIARQMLESPLVDRQFVTFRTGVFARILEPGDTIAFDHPLGHFTARPFRIESVDDSGHDIQITAKQVSEFTIDSSLLVASNQTVLPVLGRF